MRLGDLPCVFSVDGGQNTHASAKGAFLENFLTSTRTGGQNSWGVKLWLLLREKRKDGEELMNWAQQLLILTRHGEEVVVPTRHLKAHRPTDGKIVASRSVPGANRKRVLQSKLRVFTTQNHCHLGVLYWTLCFFPLRFLS